MRRRIPKELAVGLLVEDHPNLFFRYSWLLTLIGAFVLVSGSGEIRSGNYLPAFVGVVLIVLGAILFIKYGSTKVRGRLYLYPDKLVVKERGITRIIYRKEVVSVYSEIRSYEGQQMATFFKRGPIHDEGNRNLLKVYLREDFLSLRFQIKNSTMFKKFKKNIELWERSDYPI